MPGKRHCRLAISYSDFDVELLKFLSLVDFIAYYAASAIFVGSRQHLIE